MKNNSKDKNSIALAIPSLNPDHNLLKLLEGLRALNKDIEIILLDDGSREDCRYIFDEAEKLHNTTNLRHMVNQGKGRGLKTIFNYYLEQHPEGLGCVTADADGQHAPEDILKVVKSLKKHNNSLILGCRDFTQDNVPFKSRFGNKLTSWIFYNLVGMKVSDTQTGLRGLSRDLIKRLLSVTGERFEYETAMLIEVRDADIPYLSESIATIYVDGNRETHFHPIKDSISIYRVILGKSGWQAVAFTFSGLMSALIDISLYSILFYWLLPFLKIPRLFFAVLVARLISAGFNYWINRNYVFRKDRTSHFDIKSIVQYVLLGAVIMFSSYGLTRFGLKTFPTANAVLVKIIVDLFLFIACFIIQKCFIFKPKPSVQGALNDQVAS